MIMCTSLSPIEVTPIQTNDNKITIGDRTQRIPLNIKKVKKFIAKKIKPVAVLSFI